MPFINVIRGERIDPAPVNLRPPIMRIPLWLALLGWATKYTALGVSKAARHWYLTGPVLLLAWLYVKAGWWAPTGLVALVLAAGAVWWWLHAPTLAKFVGFPLLGRWRRWLYRRRWHSGMVTAGLGVRFDQ